MLFISIAYRVKHKLYEGLKILKFTLNKYAIQVLFCRLWVN